MVPLKKYILLILLTLCPFFGDLYGIFSFRGPHRVAVGPEIFFMQRNKKGGSKQRGFLYGGRFTYDRIRRSALYWGADAMYAVGKLDGHNSDSRILHSRKRDSEIEGRLGYTLKKNWGCDYYLIPFFGAGYFQGTNRFVDNSPMLYKITTNFPYITLGFLSRIDFCNSLGCGVNFKTKYSVGARGKITDDPDPLIDKSRFIVEDKFSYELDLPLYYNNCCFGKKVELAFVPFYRFRHYGGHENCPFDFIDTRFHIYGARLMFGIYF